MSQRRREDDADGPFLQRTIRAVRLLGMATSMLWGVGRWWLIAILVLVGVQALLQPVQLIALQRAVDSAIAQGGFGLWLGVLVTALALTQLTAPLSALAEAQLSDRFTRLLRSRLLRTVNSWPGMRYLEDRETLDDLDFATGKITWAGPQMLLSLVDITTDVVLLASAALLLARTQPLAAVAAILCQLPALVLQWNFQAVTGASVHEHSGRARSMLYDRRLAVAHPEAKDLRLRDGFALLHHRYAQSFATVDHEIGRLERTVGIKMLGAALVRVAGLVLAVALVTKDTAAGAASAGQLALTLGAVAVISQRFTSLGNDLGQIPLGLQVLPVIQELFSLPPDVEARTGARTSPPHGPVEIRVEDVWFTYPGNDTPTLMGVDLVVRPGETVALVGHNGCGKSTLVKLLLRFYDPDSGRILLDGTDLRDWDVAALRAAVSAVFQDYARWEFTVAEIIGVGDLPHLDDPTRIREAARAGHADAFVADLPDGYDTRLGWFVGTRDISGGQWQRLALARASMNRAPALILDEPTADLDPRAEAEVFDHYASLAERRTVVLVSHRFSTVRMADRIAVLENGVISEVGVHAELMALRGEYARLYDLQASQYLSPSAQSAGADA